MMFHSQWLLQFVSFQGGEKGQEDEDSPGSKGISSNTLSNADMVQEESKGISSDYTSKTRQTNNIGGKRSARCKLSNRV